MINPVKSFLTHGPLKTVSFNLKLASLLLVGLIRCGFMIKNQM